MIYAELTGGLGNQMFVYAFARALSLRCGEGLVLIDRQDWQGGAPCACRRRSESQRGRATPNGICRCKTR